MANCKQKTVSQLFGVIALGSVVFFFAFQYEIQNQVSVHRAALHDQEESMVENEKNTGYPVLLTTPSTSSPQSTRNLSTDGVTLSIEKSNSDVLTAEKLLVNPSNSLGVTIAEKKVPWGEIRPELVHVQGLRRKEKGFLTIGIPSIRRINGMVYLKQTIESVIQRTTEQEKKEVVLLVFLADFDRNYTAVTKIKLTELFKKYMDIGFLQLVEVEKSFYPPLHSLKRNFNDPRERVVWRSKQNADFAFMFLYAYNMSQYYVQIEDDVICADNFIQDIKDYIQQVRSKTWTMLEFSTLGFIGKLFRSEDVRQLGHYLLLFYEEQPCDWLMIHFLSSKNQYTKFIRFPTLFQHQGLHSSLRLVEQKNGLNKLKDMDFKPIGYRPINGENPTSIISTSLTQSDAKRDVLNAYNSTNDFFWALPPKEGDYILLKFLDLQRIFAVELHTGKGDSMHDFLHNGVIEIGKKASSKNANTTDKVEDCGDFVSIGNVGRCFFYYRDTSKELDFPAACLRIRVTKPQTNWLLVQHIKIESRKFYKKIS